MKDFREPLCVIHIIVYLKVSGSKYVCVIHIIVYLKVSVSKYVCMWPSSSNTLKLIDWMFVQNMAFKRGRAYFL